MDKPQEAAIAIYEELDAACEDYDPRAAEVVARVARMITSRLDGVTVEHIGSTSVPGCAGKGVVDLMVLYPPGKLEQAKALLDAIGFQRQRTRDPFPEERPMRTGAIKHDNKTFRLHAHVIAADSDEAAGLRRFRDLLRADAPVRADYIALKQAIIESGVTDTLDYSNAKDEFIKGILSG